MLRGIEPSLLPYVTIGKVEELEVLTREAPLDGVDKGPADCVVVVEPCRDQVREALGQFGRRSLDHRQVEYVPRIDWPENLPLRVHPDSLLVSRGHVGMKENQPVEILIRLAAHGE